MKLDPFVLEGKNFTRKVWFSKGPEQSRHEDYVCNDSFANFVAEEVVNWARTLLPSIQSSRNMICEVSLSGLASAHIALK